MSPVQGGGALFARRVATAFLPFAAGYFLSYLFRSVNAIIGPDLVADLGLDAAGLGLLTSAYFAAFALFQIPLGILLDRFGPRRVECTLMLVAAAGAAAFALGTDAVTLAISRALIGLGVSACLMAAFKANSVNWPRERLALANGCLLAFGGLGAATATLPVQLALEFWHWRELFWLLSALSALAAGYLFLAAPEAGGSGGLTLREQLSTARLTLGHPLFWRVVPLAVTIQSTFLSYQSLWAGPWLRDVAGLDRHGVATTLFILSLAAMPGYALTGFLADRLTRRGLPATGLMAGQSLIFLAIQTPLALGWTGAPTLLWALFGTFGTGSVLAFTILSQGFPPAVTGRVTTALNLLVFCGAFAVQAGIGAIIGAFPAPAGRYSSDGHFWAYILMVGLECLALIWFLLPRRHPLR